MEERQQTPFFADFFSSWIFVLFCLFFVLVWMKQTSINSNSGKVDVNSC